MFPAESGAAQSNSATGSRSSSTYWGRRGQELPEGAEVVAVGVPGAGAEDAGGHDRHARLDQAAGLEQHRPWVGAVLDRALAVAFAELGGLLVEVEGGADPAGRDQV